MVKRYVVNFGADDIVESAYVAHQDDEIEKVEVIVNGESVYCNTAPKNKIYENFYLRIESLTTNKL